MFKGMIIEFPGFISISDSGVFDKYFFFKEGERIVKLDDTSEIRSTFEHNNLTSFCVDSEGIWAQYSVLKDSRIVDCETEFIDVFEKGISYDKDEIPVASGIFYNKNYICSYQELKSRKDILYIKNFNTQEVKSISKELSVLSTDGVNIFSRSIGGELSCFDFNLEPIWSKTHNKKVYSRAGLSPLLFNDLVIINIGVDKNSKEGGEILAYRKANGHIAWNKVFNKEAVCKLIGKNLYVAHNGRMTILDAATGKILVDEPAKFEKADINDVLCANTNALTYISYLESTIRVFTNDGKTQIQDLKIPEPYCLFGGQSFVNFNAKYHLALSIADPCLRGAFYGLLVLEPVGNKRIFDIRREKRPTYIVKTLRTKKDEEEFHIIIEEQKISTIIRFGEIIIKEYSQTHGSQMWSEGRENKKFNGKIYFSTTPYKLSEKFENEIKKMTLRTEKWLKSMGIEAGNKKGRIRIEIVPPHDANL